MVVRGKAEIKRGGHRKNTCCARLNLSISSISRAYLLAYISLRLLHIYFGYYVMILLLFSMFVDDIL